LETANWDWDTVDKKEKQIGESITYISYIMLSVNQQYKKNEIKNKIK